MNKKDKYIKEMLQKDKEISENANQIFENIKHQYNLEKANKKVPVTITLKRYISITASLIIILFLGTNIYAHVIGKPNIFSMIENMFNVDKEEYQKAEEEINLVSESNGIKITLKTAAIDDNVMINKYQLEGEKIESQFYTYQDFENSVIKYNEEKEKNKKKNNVENTVEIKKETINKLIKNGFKKEEAIELFEKAEKAYKDYNDKQEEKTEKTDEEIKETIEKIILEYKEKIKIDETILESEDIILGLHKRPVAQKIEKEDDKYIVYTIYNVNDMSDLSEIFDIKININKVGDVKGEWGFNVKLNKSRLNNRIETIKFYENNEFKIEENYLEEKGKIKATATSLTISDFSSVLVIQTNTMEEANHFYLNPNDKSRDIPFRYIVLDEKNNVVGEAKSKEEELEKNKVKHKFTDRIILKNIKQDIKRLKIKIYSDRDNRYLGKIDLDIEKARQYKKIELAKEYENKEKGIKFKYPDTWKVLDSEKFNEIYINSPETVDGTFSNILINIYENEEIDTIDSYIEKWSIEESNQFFERKILDKGKTIYKSKETGYIERQKYEKREEEYWMEYEYVFFIGKDMYTIKFEGNEIEYKRNFPIFKKIIETIEIEERQEENKPNPNENQKPDNELDNETHVEKDETLKYVYQSKSGITIRYPEQWSVGKLLGHEEECISLITHDVNKELRMLIKATKTGITKKDYIRQNIALDNNLPKETIKVDDIEVTIINEINTVSPGGRNEKASKMIAKTNETIYEIEFSGTPTLYNQYLNTFKSIVKEIEFNSKENNNQEIDESKITNSENDINWTKYSSPGIDIEYPSDFKLEEVGGYNRGSNPGALATKITGLVIGKDPNTKEIRKTEMEILVYEVDFAEGLTEEGYLEKYATSNGTYIDSNKGLRWYEHFDTIKFGKTDMMELYTNYDTNLGSGVRIQFNLKDLNQSKESIYNMKIMNIVNHILGTAQRRSY